jgi:hypothetical protein
MSAAMTTSPAMARRITPREPDALAAREVDRLVSKLLGEIKVPFGSLGTRVLTQLADLKRILSTDYMEVPALPQKPLLKELAEVVEKDIKQHIPTYGNLSDLGSPQLLGHLGKLFGPRELELRAEPYRTGAGLSLRGFYCRADVGDKSKFVIFVNTAHHPGAVGATLGHASTCSITKMLTGPFFCSSLSPSCSWTASERLGPEKLADKAADLWPSNTHDSVKSYFPIRPVASVTG